MRPCLYTFSPRDPGPEQLCRTGDEVHVREATFASMDEFAHDDEGQDRLDDEERPIDAGPVAGQCAMEHTKQEEDGSGQHENGPHGMATIIPLEAMQQNNKPAETVPEPLEPL